MNSPETGRMKLAAADWSITLKLLDEALDRPAADREAWLESLAPQHRHLLPMLRQLLDDRRAIETGDFLQALPPLPATAAPAGFAVGHRIGPWALLRELGQGGMASVWLAERADGAHKREVALKLPWLGARARVIGERFAREREILSALTHPHIASVLDAGVDDKQPWLALEYVQGQPITAYAQAQGLITAAKLRLFLQVLQAVQHAHAQLVIHRDLKPSNVMVDEQGQVKLLDFGVAKLLDDDGASRETELTQLGGRAMTPQYASPEQVAGHALGTASDVYSLGVLLYELLTGRLPYILKRDTPAALEEAILAANVQPPSAVALDKTTARALRGDLDTIVMKALAAAPGDRYPSAESMAQDIGRLLQSLPIHARPASLSYRLRKAVVRHRLAYGVGAAVSIALALGVAATLWQAREARAEARRAEAVQQFLIKTLTGADPEVAQGRELTARELLARTAGQIDTDFKDQPDVQAALHYAMISLFDALGEPARATYHADRAVQVLESAGRTAEDMYLDARSSQVDLLVAANDPRAREMAEAAIAGIRRVRGEPNPWTGNLLADLAWIENVAGRPSEALAIGERALQAERAASAGVTARYIGLMQTVASVAIDANLQRAREILMQADALTAQMPAYSISDRQNLRYNLARVDTQLGEFESAESTLRELVPQINRHVGRQAELAVIARSQWAQSLVQLARYDEALLLQREAVADVRARPGAGEEAVTLQTLTLARLLLRAGRYDEGLRLARDALGTLERLHTAPTLFRERTRFDLGLLLLATGEGEAGRKHLRRALDNFELLGGDSRSPSRANDRLAWAVALRTTDVREAVDAARDACSQLRVRLPAERLFVLRCEAIQAWLAAAGADAAARPAALASFISARSRLLPLLPGHHPLRAELLAAEAELLDDDPERHDQARELHERASVEYLALLGVPLARPLLVLH